MNLRHIYIPRLLFEIMRAQYALDNNPSGRRLNLLYRFLFACLSPINNAISDYESQCAKYFALASNDGSCISIQSYMNQYYGQYGAITIGATPVFDTIMWDYDGQDDHSVVMYDYSADQSEAVTIYNYGSTSNTPSIYIPAGLKNDTARYEDFIADLNALTAYGIQYAIITQ